MFKKAKEGSILTVISEFPIAIRDSERFQSMMSDAMKNGGYVVAPPTKVTVESDDDKVTIISEDRQTAYTEVKSSYSGTNFSRSIATGGSVIFVATSEDIPETKAASLGPDLNPKAFEYATTSRMAQTAFTANGEPLDPNERLRYKNFLIESSLKVAEALASPFVKITVDGQTELYFNDAFDK